MPDSLQNNKGSLRCRAKHGNFLPKRILTTDIWKRYEMRKNLSNRLYPSVADGRKLPMNMESESNWIFIARRKIWMETEGQKSKQ